MSGRPGDGCPPPPRHHFSVGQYGLRCPIAAFRGSYPPVTPLEKGVGSVNLTETSAAAISFKLRGDAAPPAATTGTACSGRQAPACRDGHCCGTLLCRSGGMGGGSPPRPRPN